MPSDIDLLISLELWILFSILSKTKMCCLHAPWLQVIGVSVLMADFSNEDCEVCLMLEWEHFAVAEQRNNEDKSDNYKCWVSLYINNSCEGMATLFSIYDGFFFSIKPHFLLRGGFKGIGCYFQLLLARWRIIINLLGCVILGQCTKQPIQLYFTIIPE